MLKKEFTEEKAITCSICSTKFDEKDKGKASRVLSTPCNHLFHRGCLRNWFRSHENCCPKCRRTMNWRDAIPTEKQLTIAKTLAIRTSEFSVQSVDAEMKQRKAQEQLQKREQQAQEEKMKALKARRARMLERQQNRLPLKEIRIYTDFGMINLRTVGLALLYLVFYASTLHYFYSAAKLSNSILDFMTKYWRAVSLAYAAYYAGLLLSFYFAPNESNCIFEPIKQLFGRNFKNVLQFWNQWTGDHQTCEDGRNSDKEKKKYVDWMLTQTESLDRLEAKVRALKKKKDTPVRVLKGAVKVVELMRTAAHSTKDREELYKLFLPKLRLFHKAGVSLNEAKISIEQ